MTRKLTLAKETLSDLSTEEMRSVVGAGTHVTCQTGITWCPCTGLINDPTISSVDQPCGTI